MKIKTAIVGVGNCAKSLVEGVSYYSKDDSDSYGLLNTLIGPYRVSDIDFVAAFDVDRRKVGLKLSEAILAPPNKTKQLFVPLKYETIVKRGPSFDSIIPELREYFIDESGHPPVDVANELKQAQVDVAINYLPTGSDQATYAYAEAALSAGCSFINCMPTRLARDPEWRHRFETAGLILMGDDVKSQCGATIVNRSILRLFGLRGVKVLRSEQVNYGGNADHFNLQYRADAKEVSKEEALESIMTCSATKPTACMVYAERNYDHKRAEIIVEGTIFGGAPVSVKLTLDDEDSPNSAGIVVDAIRAAKVLSENHMYTDAADVSSFLMKAPPQQYSDEEAAFLFRKILGITTSELSDHYQKSFLRAKKDRYN